MAPIKKLIFLLFLSSVTLAFKVFPVPFTKQLNDSDGIIQGEFLGDSSKKHRDGSIITEASFKINKSRGIGAKYLVNKNLFKIYYKGGVWQGLVHKNINAPKLKMGKEYIVLVKRTSFGFVPYMDKLGFYEVSAPATGEVILTSIAFPEHKSIGSVPYNRFNLWVKTTYGAYLEEFHSDKFIATSEDGKTKSRSPASIEDPSEGEGIGPNSIGIVWVAMIFGFMGAMRMRSVKKGE